MFHFSKVKSIAILLSVIIAMIYALPNVAPASWLPYLAKIGARPMTLGLDLQGGSNVVMEINRDDLKSRLTEQLSSDVRATLRENKIGYNNLNRSDNSVSVRITNPADYEKANQVLKLLDQPLNTGFLGGGASLSLYTMTSADGQAVFTFSEAGLDFKISAAINQSVKIIENRINALGTSEAAVQQQGKDRIVIQLPGIQNTDEVKAVLGKTAKLTLQLLCVEQPTAPVGQMPPQGCKALPLRDNPAQINWVQTGTLATVDGADLVDAQPGFDQYNRPVVTFKLNQKGSLRFGRLTADNTGKPFAIILDDEIVSAPNINEPILGGSAQISGNFTPKQTSDMAVVLRSGALPAKLRIVQETTVGPSLGSDSIKAGFKASVIALVLVVIFMIVAYGLFGIFADIALVINLIMVVAIMSVMGFTLTLPGIAAIVLTMGMAVDSNVIIFERIREEWRSGRTAVSSIDIGFKAALATILDSNLTALIAAIVLFGVGSGPVRGFAITHAIGILTTMYTAYTVTRYIVALWVRWRKPKEVPL